VEIAQTDLEIQTREPGQFVDTLLSMGAAYQFEKKQVWINNDKV
jgi:hypothetical protein